MYFYKLVLFNDNKSCFGLVERAANIFALVISLDTIAEKIKLNEHPRWNSIRNYSLLTADGFYYFYQRSAVSGLIYENILFGIWIALTRKESTNNGFDLDRIVSNIPEQLAHEGKLFLPDIHVNELNAMHAHYISYFMNNNLDFKNEVIKSKIFIFNYM